MKKKERYAITEPCLIQICKICLSLNRFRVNSRAKQAQYRG